MKLGLLPVMSVPAQSRARALVDSSPLSRILPPVPSAWCIVTSSNVYRFVVASRNGVLGRGMLRAQGFGEVEVELVGAFDGHSVLSGEIVVGHPILFALAPSLVLRTSTVRALFELSSPSNEIAVPGHDRDRA